MQNNPFTLIFGIEPMSSIPRNEEFFHITSDFESVRPASPGYVVTGVRGCGKTVLMTSIQKYFAEKNDWIVLRLNPDLDLFSSAVSQLGEYIHLKDLVSEVSLSIAGFGGSASVRSLSDNETLLRKMLKEAGKRKKRVLITIDEASNTKELKTFAHSYQAFIGEGLPLFLLMTALPENFSALSNSKNGTFLKRLPKVRLGALSDILVGEKYKEIFGIPDETAIEFAKTVRGYSYAFQLLGSLLWDAGKKAIDAEIISRLDSLLYDGSYEAIWKNVTNKEKQVLCAIAHSSLHTVREIRDILRMETNQFSPYRENLKERGLINTDSYGIITFSLPRFEEFVLKAELFAMT